jgi:hypothetical protein
MATDLPLNNPSMVTDGGMGYFTPDAPAIDAYPLTGTDQNGVLGAPASMPAPLDGVSLKTQAIDAPPLGAFQRTNLHQDNWLDPTKPHVSQEPQE